MLHAGRAVEVEVLLDLALPAALGRLVDREHDLVVVPHDGRHQRRVLGGDLVVVEVGELVEAEDLLVVRRPTRSRWPRSTLADDVVEPRDARPRDRPAARGRWARTAARTGPCRPTGRGRCARCRRRRGWRRGGSRRAASSSLAGSRSDGARRGRARRRRPRGRRRRGSRCRGCRRRGVRTCSAIGLSGCERARHHEAHPALLEQVADAVAAPGLGAGVGDEVEAEGRGEEPGEGAGVAHPPLEVVDAAEGGGRRAWRGGHRSTPASWSAHSPSQNACTPSSIRAAPARKRSLVEPRLGERLDELVVGVGGVLVLDLVVPGPERERQVGALAGLERLEPGDELLPEPGGRPVLHRVAGALGGRTRPRSRTPRAARRRRTAWAAVPWRRLPSSSNPRPSGAAKRSSHSKWAAPKRKRPPSTVPSVATSSGSVPAAAAARGRR